MDLITESGQAVRAMHSCNSWFLLSLQGPITIRVETIPLDRTEARSNVFTEQQAFWEIPMHETNIICDLGVTKGKIVLSLTPNVIEVDHRNSLKW